MKHGKYSTYKNHGCRCAACTKAVAAYQRDYTHRKGLNKPFEQYLAERYPEPPPHGTETRYTGHRCRCAACREASRVARAQRRAKA